MGFLPMKILGSTAPAFNSLFDTTLPDGTIVRYGTTRGFPQPETVEAYLQQTFNPERINRKAVVRIREGTTPERVDLTVRAVQAVNSALPLQHRMQVDPRPKPMGEEPGPYEISVTFAPIREWVGWPLPPGPSSVIGWMRPFPGETVRSEVWIDSHYVDRQHTLDGQKLVTVAHELIHALGFWDHVESGLALKLEGAWGPHVGSIMKAGGDSPYDNGGALYPIDRAALFAAITDPEDLGAWNDESTHFHGRLKIGEGPIDFLDFGVTHRNGHLQPWAFGHIPGTNLADNQVLTGTVYWDGHLLGFTPLLHPVAGNARLTVDLELLDGSIKFSELKYWDTGIIPIDGPSTTWGDGDLEYAVRVRGNTFVQAHGDEGTVTGAFFGNGHEGMAGTLQRDDLTAAFGGKRR